MKFLNNLWPWKEIARLNGEIDFLKRTLEHEQTSHNLTRASLQDHKLELIDHRSRVSQGQKDIRKLATILAIRGGITILFLFLSLSAFGQPLQRQLFTTNTLPLLSSISGPMVTTNGSGQPELTFNGAGLTNITGVAVKQGTNILITTNGQVVTVNGVTDTNVVNILLVPLSNYVSTVSVNATNEALLIGLNGTNANTLLGSNATNNDQLFGLNATNEALLIGLNGTNANTLLGSNATNNDSASALAITNGAINNLTNNIATKQLDSLNTANSVIVEEFPCSSGNSLTIGTHGWREQHSAGGTFSIGAGVVNHPGIAQITTGTVSGEGALICLGTTNSTSVNTYPALNAITGWTNIWTFQLSATNDTVMYMGMVNNLVFLSTEPADWIGLKVDSTSLNAYQFVSRTGGSSTTASGPALDTGVFHTFRMWSTVSGTVAFNIDNAAPSTIASIPAVTTAPMAMVRKSAINNTVTLKIDYYAFVMTGLSR